MEEIKRKDHEMDKDFAYQIIDKAEFGSLATINEDKTPYSVPISFVRIENIIYIHSSTKGTKITNIINNPEVSMSFVGDINIEESKEDLGIKEKLNDIFTAEFESSIIFGTASIVENRTEKVLALKLLSEKYTPNKVELLNDAVKNTIDNTTIIKIEIKKITGKRKKYEDESK